MAESISIPETSNREVMYKSLVPQINSVIADESDLIANMANVASILHEAFGFFWVGFYRNIDGELVLGPFQGPLACTRIKEGKGVCGSSMQQKQTLLVPDVDKFPGHIACSSLSRSEIVIPGIKNDQVLFVLDVDSKELDDFSEIDKVYLETTVQQLVESTQGGRPDALP